MSKFRTWMTTRPHELKGRSRLSDENPTKRIFTGVIQKKKRLLTISNYYEFFGMESPKPLDFEPVGEALLTVDEEKVQIGTNGTVYVVVVDEQIVVLTSSRRLAEEAQLSLSFGS